LSNLFKLIQTCSIEFTVHSIGLSTKSAGIRRLGISLFIFSIKWILADFYRIRVVFLKTNKIGGGDFLVSVNFLNTDRDLVLNTRRDLVDGSPVGRLIALRLRQPSLSPPPYAFGSLVIFVPLIDSLQLRWLSSLPLSSEPSPLCIHYRGQLPADMWVRIFPLLHPS
jgi:hypothetical protein